MKIKIVLALLLISALGWSQKTREEPPNIILIIADDVGADDIGCYGNTEVETPNIDRMATEGIQFTNAYLTTSSCSPSRSSIISGRYPHNTGAAELHSPMPAEIPVFPEFLEEAGYFTAQAGKFHMSDPVKRGFNTLHLNKKENGDGGEKMWVQTLKDRPRDQPFFMWFASHDAHRPWGENEFSGTHNPDEITPPKYLADMEPTREDLAKFYDEVKRFDFYIGEVEKELKRQGVLDNTLIIIMADNGKPFPRAKTRVYDSGMRTPFVVKWNNGITNKGAVSESLLSAVDIAPTIMELAGVEKPSSFQGESFSALFRNPDKEFRNYVFSEHNWHDYQAFERMVRTREHLYVLNLRPNLPNSVPGIRPSPSIRDLRKLRDSGKLTDAQADVFEVPRPYEEFYDVKKDSLQLLNIVSLGKYEKDLDKLREVMLQWRQETIDPDPENLTLDWYDRETGAALEAKGKRGEMPGGEKALQTRAGGPF